MLYKLYISDSFKALLKSEVRYADLIRDDKPDERSPDDIKDEIKGKLRRLGNGFFQHSSETGT